MGRSSLSSTGVRAYSRAGGSLVEHQLRRIRLFLAQVDRREEDVVPFSANEGVAAG